MMQVPRGLSAVSASGPAVAAAASELSACAKGPLQTGSGTAPAGSGFEPETAVGEPALREGETARPRPAYKLPMHNSTGTSATRPDAGPSTRPVVSALRAGMMLAVPALLLVATGCELPEKPRKPEVGSGPAPASERTRTPGRPMVAFLSDFGDLDDAVAVCKAEMLKAAPDALVLDVCHKVPAFDIHTGARLLAQASETFPETAVFVAVVDPGVGGTRRPVALRTAKGQVFVLPDNGLITLVAERDGVVEAREIRNPDLLAGRKLSSTFHGRDIFSPVAGKLAAEIAVRGSADGLAWATLGPAVPVRALVRLKIALPSLNAAGLSGSVIGLDGPYGNVITDVTAEQFAGLGWRVGDRVTVRLGDGAGAKSLTVPFARTFSDVGRGEPLLYVDSRGRIALAINLGNFAEVHRVVPPLAVLLPRKV